MRNPPFGMRRSRFIVKPAPTFCDGVRKIAASLLILAGFLYLRTL